MQYRDKEDKQQSKLSIAFIDDGDEGQGVSFKNNITKTFITSQ